MSNRKGRAKRKPRPFSVSNRLKAQEFACRLFKAVDTPVSLACYLLLKNGEHDQLVEHAIDPLDYESPAAFFLDYQCVELLSKFPNLDVSFDPTENAIRKFLEAEHQCELANARLISKSREDSSQLPAVESVLFRAQQKISSILGDVPSLSDLDLEFGPGASYCVRKETSVYNKVLSDPECTFAMRPILDDLVRELPGWLGNESVQVTLREGSELAFVPKNAKTHRSICIEPTLNGLLQKGYGSYMRRRLRRHGVNLDDQSVNQRLASVAHRDDLATVDFSSASDTISYGLVLDLLPFTWFEALDVARSPSYWVDGSCYEFNKFSSMGNAYTFELETLIFYAIAFASCEHLGIEVLTGQNLSVYGDDVIIPTDAFTLFQSVCDHVGFSVNREKTNTQGPFFESCGHDYFLGAFVRPFFIRKELKSLEDYYHATNSVLEMVDRLESVSSPCDDHSRTVACRLRNLHAWCIGCIPRRHRLLVPKGSGDCGLAAGFDVAVPARATRGWCGYRYRGVRSLPVKKAMPETGWPKAYPLYFAGRATSQLKRKRPLRTVVFDELRDFKDVPSGVYNSEGYTVRNRTKTKTLIMFWFGPWPDCTRWGQESLLLLAKKNRSKQMEVTQTP